MEVDNKLISPIAGQYLRLQMARNVGPVCARKLVDRFGSIEAVFTASIAALEAVEGVGRQRAEAVLVAKDSDAFEREIEAAEKRGLRILCREDGDYPKLLHHIPDPPLCLYVRGQLEPEDGLAVAIVGSRRCTRYGLEQAERFGALLAGAGFTVVSGMARGADTAGHRGALSVGGRTIAVLGCGLGHIYPPEHVDLADEICGSGAVISALPIDTAPLPANFPPRNRIVVGISLGVLVIEAAKRSGALISARLANEYNREVFALPGLVNNPYAFGTNALIRDGGAKLVTCLEDILDELGEAGRMMRPDESKADAESGQSPSAAVKLDEAERCIVDVLSTEDTPLELICEQSGLSPAVVAATLTKLQLKGVITQRPGNVFVRRESQ